MNAMLVRISKAALTFILFAFAVAVPGQVATGNYTYGTFDNQGLDSINVGNLNVHFSLPVLNKTGRGMPFYYNLVFDSSTWYPSSVSGSSVWTPVQAFGWHGDTEVSTGYVSYSTEQYILELQDGEDFTETTNHYFTYHDSFGGQHPFDTSTVKMYCWGSNKPGYCTEQYPSFTEVATDGSGYTLTVSNYTTTVITGPTGKQFSVSSSASGSATVTDSNGNKISADGSGNFTDTTGNMVLTVAGAGTAASAKTFTYKDTSGNAQSVTMTYANYTVQTKFGCSGIGEYGPTVTPLVHTVAYPDGSTYTLSYEATPGVSGNVTGRIASVELPQGNTISYTYSGGSNGIECSDGSTAGLTRTLNSDSGSAASSWTYNRTITGTSTSTTAVADGLGNNKTYTFVEASNQPAGTTAAYYETSRTVYQGAASGTPVVARNTCYDGAASPCSTATFKLPVSQIDTYETLDGFQTHGATAKYNAHGAQTEADVYDYTSGTSSRGSLLRKGVWTYGSSFTNLPTQYAVYDGSGTLSGKTTYAYDGTTPTASSGVPMHVAVTTARGNLTSSAQYASSGISYTSTFTYEDTGSLLTSSTPSGTTTLSYNSAFVYNTGTSLPTPSSGIAIGTSESFDTSSTGLPLTATDANANVTTAASYNSMLRPTEIDYPDGGKVAYSYSPTTFDQKVYQTSNAYSETVAEYDGYGRASSAFFTSGLISTPYYQQDTCYDANGNASFASYTYLATSTSDGKVCSGAGDTTSYDVLGRVTRVVRQNGETTSYTYSGRATKKVDPNGIAHITQTDGLGRPAIACEVSSNSLTGGSSPASCGTDISGTGYTTTYAYSLASGTTTITQGAQTRSFQADWLGRTTSISEPESGTTSYSYAYNGTGLQVTRTKPQANQTGSATTTTTTQYDSLGRVISITYSDGTPTKTYAYDAGAGSNFSGFTQTNLKGLLSSASTSNTGSAFSYDAVGRIVGMSECLPSGCGTVSRNKQLQYTYDTAGNMLTSTDGNGVQSTYSVDSANHVTAVTSSLNDATDPGSLLSNVQYGAFGPSAYSLGNGLYGVFEYDALGRLSSGGVKKAQTPDQCYVLGSGYRFSNKWRGAQLINSVDSAQGQAASYGYDEFNRLTSRTITAATTGLVQNLAWDYDRYGNRWHQTMTSGTGSVFQPSFAFSSTTNRIINSGIIYDAAGNMANDGIHAYSYDADGNLISVDNGATAAYTYNALNQRVRTVVGSMATEFVFNANGLRVSEWSGNSPYTIIKGQYYWGAKPLAYYYSGATHFQHQDWLGTERMRTSYSGKVEAKFTSLPFGDSQETITGSDTEANHYAMLDHDSEDDTDHAQFRQYSGPQGRWLAPDPYSGSYDVSNPQSFNRYVYALNNPLSNIDPSGLDYCTGYNATESYNPSTGTYGGQTQQPTNWSDCEAAGGIWVTTDDQTTQITTIENLYVYGSDSLDDWSGTGIGFNYYDANSYLSDSTSSGGGSGGSSGASSKNFDPNDPSYQLAVALGQNGAYTIDDPRFVVGFYGTSFAGAVGVVAVTDIAAVQEGLIFGTRAGGNSPLLNSSNALRIGWSYIRSTGEYTFRIGGDLVESIKVNPHINLWPPSWWFK